MEIGKMADEKILAYRLMGLFLSLMATMAGILACSGSGQDGTEPTSVSGPSPSITFMEGNDCTQPVVSQIAPAWGQVVEAGAESGFANDEARSVLLDGVPAGTLIRVFDSRNGDTSDDWAEILISASVQEQCIRSFEEDYNDDALSVVYHTVNGLDGKVSRVEVMSAAVSTPEATVARSATALIPTNEVMPTTTPVESSPARTTAPTRTRLPTSTTQPPGLPGLAPADVTVNLEQRGLTCSSAEPTFDGGFVWSCSREAFDVLLYVDIYSSSLVTVDMIDASVTFYSSPDNDLASQFLGFIATMPYDGAQPLDAREWVETALPTIRASGDVRETTIGGVDFILFGAPSARSLEMGDLGD